MDFGLIIAIVLVALAGYLLYTRVIRPRLNRDRDGATIGGSRTIDNRRNLN